VHDEGFEDGAEGAAPGPSPIVDGLFARRRDDAQPRSNDLQRPQGMADDLFSKRAPKQDGIPPIAIGSGAEGADEEDEEEADEEEDGAADGGATGSRARCCRFCVCLPERGFADISESLPSRRVMATCGGGSLVVIGLLALGTISLAMGCDSDAPLGRFCISEGPVQWIIAFLPLVLLSCASYCLFRRSYQTKVEASRNLGNMTAKLRKVLPNFWIPWLWPLRVNATSMQLKQFRCSRTFLTRLSSSTKAVLHLRPFAEHSAGTFNMCTARAQSPRSYMRWTII